MTFFVFLFPLKMVVLLVCFVLAFDFVLFCIKLAFCGVYLLPSFFCKIRVVVCVLYDIIVFGWLTCADVDNA